MRRRRRKALRCKRVSAVGPPPAPEPPSMPIYERTRIVEASSLTQEHVLTSTGRRQGRAMILAPKPARELYGSLKTPSRSGMSRVLVGPLADPRTGGNDLFIHRRYLNF